MSISLPQDHICAQCGSRIPNSPTCPQCSQPSYLCGRYLLLSVLGQGAEGVTYLAHDSQTSATVVIKEHLWKPLQQDTRHKRLKRTIDVLSQIRHPQIPQCLDYTIVQEGRRSLLYVVQEYIEGPTLHERLVKARFQRHEIWKIAEELLDVLVYLQEFAPPIIHRDIKPSNIIIHRHTQKACLIDFGSLRDTLSDPELGSSTYAGTAGYMPPEQFFGHSDCRSDLYSLGAVIVELLTKEAPAKVLHPPIWLHKTSLSSEFQGFIQKLCHRDPQKRFPHAQRARSVLRSLLNSPPTAQAHPPKLLEELRMMLRSELSQHLPSGALPPRQNPVTPFPITPSISSVVLPQDRVAPSLLSDRVLSHDIYEQLPPNRRGWWKAKPPRPKDEQLQPLHPAVHICLMSAAMVLSGILLQLIF